MTYIFPIFVIFTACIVQCGCGRGGHTPEGTKNHVRLIRRTVDRVPSLDPIYAESAAASRCVGLVYETLLQYDYYARPYAVVPYVAAEMPVFTNNGRVLTFKLRDDVFFGPDKCFAGSDGKPAVRKLVARDVEYSLKRLADAKLSAPGWRAIEGRILGLDEFHKASLTSTVTDYGAAVAGIEIPDDRTVVLRLTEPSPQLLWVFAMPYTSVVPREAIKYYGGAFSSVETGSGPFTLKSWKRDYELRFVRRLGRDQTRDRLRHSDAGFPPEEIRYLVVDDASTKWMSFLSGKLDVNGEISRDNWDAVIDETGRLSHDMSARGVTLCVHDGLSTYYIGFNMDDPVVGGDSGIGIRRAVSCAFDSAEWIQLNMGRVSQAFGPVPPGISQKLETPSPYLYDLKKAGELLSEAGYPAGIDRKTGRRLELTLELGRTDQETRESAELFASFMEKIGISVKLHYNNWPLFLKKIGRREAQMFFMSWIADFPDAMNFMQLFYSVNASPGPNRANFSNAEFDALYKNAINVIIAEKRLAAVKRMQEIICEQCPWVFVHHGRENMLVGPWLRNVIPHDFPYGMEKHWLVAGQARKGDESDD